jgi:hypothetical protein
VSISLLGHAPAFLGIFSHDTIVVALSLSFLNVVKSCYLFFFFMEKTAKNKKKRGAFENLLPHISTTGFRTKFQLILEGIFQGYNFCFFTILGS